MRTRRSFLRAAALAVAAASIVPATVSRSLTGQAVRPTLPALDHDTLAPLQGSSFKLQANGAASVEMVLTKVTKTPSQPQLEGFSLLFRAPAQTALGQATYAFYHPQLGHHEIFIVPQTASEQHCFYEAVFNRLV